MKMQYFTVAHYARSKNTLKWSSLDKAKLHAAIVWADRDPDFQHNPVKRIDVVNDLGIVETYTA